MLPHQLAGLTRILRASIAPFLLLLTPFASYLHYNKATILSPEVMVAVLLIAGLALLLGAVSEISPVFAVTILAALAVFFIDIQAREPGLKRLGLIAFALCAVFWLLRRHAARIVSLMMATMLAISFLPSRPAASASNQRLERVVSGDGADRPLILHLLFDEYIGSEGLPHDLAPEAFKQQFQSFYVDRGFRLFGKAYSEYQRTSWSVPELLNLSPAHYIPDLLTAGRSDGTYQLTRNAYFEGLSNLGYAIKVHQPDYLDLCPENLAAASCRTHPTRSLDMLPRLKAPVAAKLSIIGGAFLGQSEAYRRAKENYQTTRLRWVKKNIPLPPWNWEQEVPVPVGTAPMFDAVAQDLSKASPGTFVFAHFLLPHYPYVYDANCEQRTDGKWLNRSDYDHDNGPGGIRNVPESRAERYRAYFQQLLCAQKKVDGLIASIPPALRQDAIIIVQGDHGSRISLVDPSTKAQANLVPSDYADAFSTLFAVRSPTIERGYDERLAPITCILRALAESDFQSTSGVDSCSSPNIVFFLGTETPQQRPFVDFWTTPATAQRRANGSAK